MNFNDYYWHDSVIKSISINRNNPGIIDEISFDIQWNEGILERLNFEDVYWASLMLNFGIVADETIMRANVLDNNDSDLVNFYEKWGGLMDNVKLQVYLIELNSTGSLIKIIAKGFKTITL